MTRKTFVQICDTTKIDLSFNFEQFKKKSETNQIQQIKVTSPDLNIYRESILDMRKHPIGNTRFRGKHPDFFAKIPEFAPPPPEMGVSDRKNDVNLTYLYRKLTRETHYTEKVSSHAKAFFILFVFRHVSSDCWRKIHHHWKR